MTALFAQTPVQRPPTKLNEAQAELDERLRSAQAERVAGDPIRIANADKRILALALGELAQVRLLQSAYPQAMSLYRRSLDFEDVPETHLDLAIAEVGALETDAAASEAQKFLGAHPDSVRALSVLARANSLKGDYETAAQYLARAATREPSVELLYSWATSLLDSRDPGQKQKAGEVFQRLTEFAGDSGSLHVMFGRAYRDAGDMPAAVREFRRAIALDPKTPHAHYFLGLASLSMNEWAPTDQSVAEFLEELRYYPRDYLANYMLGFVYSLQRNYLESNVRLYRAAELDPKLPEPHLYLGLNAYEQGDTDKAEEHLRRAIALTGEDDARAVYQIRRAYITLGRILQTSGRGEEATPLLKKGRDLQNRVLELSQREIGRHLLEQGGEVAAVVLPTGPEKPLEYSAIDGAAADPYGSPSIATLDRSSLNAEEKRRAEQQEKSLRAVLAAAFSDLATIEAKTGIYQSAVGHYLEAERWDAAVPRLYRNLGAAAFRLQNYPEAIRALSQALIVEPSDAPIRAMLGSAYFASDNFANAAQAISPLGERALHDPVLGYTWAASLVRIGDLKEAARILDAAEKNPLPPETVLLVGQLWTDIGDYSRAIESFHQALALNPQAPRVHYFSGITYTQWQKQTEAIAEFRAQLAITPDDPDTKNNLGYVFLQQGKSGDAESLFREVLQARPDNGMAHYQLGKILLERQDITGALEHLQIAARVLPEADYVHYQLQAAYRKASRNADADFELQRYRDLKAHNRQASIPRPQPATP
jgi:tetratricopeptide (TPR) repeat protein